MVYLEKQHRFSEIREVFLRIK